MHSQVQTKAKMEELLKRHSPENKAKWKALQTLSANAATMAAMRRGMSVFVNHASIAALNTWHEMVVNEKAKAEKLRKALARMSPEGRAMLKVIEKLQDLARAAHAMERAVRSFMNAAPRKAFATWRCLQGVRMQGLKSTVWLAAQRGHRVGALQDMFEALEPAVVEELLHSTDELGMTPLLWAAKRGALRMASDCFGLPRIASDGRARCASDCFVIGGFRWLRESFRWLPIRYHQTPSDAIRCQALLHSPHPFSPNLALRSPPLRQASPTCFI